MITTRKHGRLRGDLIQLKAEDGAARPRRGGPARPSEVDLRAAATSRVPRGLARASLSQGRSLFRSSPRQPQQKPLGCLALVAPDLRERYERNLNPQKSRSLLVDLPDEPAERRPLELRGLVRPVHHGGWCRRKTRGVRLS
jgi:hypothetical protein